MKKYIIGALIGSVLTISATAGAAAVKQYILTDASYPIVVNGKEYKDAAAPILNYEGSTYVPLAKLGDLTGVNYTWNDQAKRVEILTSGEPVADGDMPLKEEVVYEHDKHPEATDSVTGATPSGGTLTPDTKVVDPHGLVKENGETVFYAYDRDGNFKGRFTDSDDAELTIALIEKRPVLPPKTSEGWIGLDILCKIFNDADIKYEGNDLILKTSPSVTKQVEYLRLTLPDGWRNNDSGEGTAGSIKIKRHNKYTYFNIEDLQKAGIIK
ncbi:hypothetical protein GCM10023310_00950 [Paenibacillus vulneris]|uniref:Stalk domain-containing protein n=1 Tax=Paenibacillus vulneris TaxID=1133364 RepID=A0ABW3V0F7_9BACL